MIRRNDKPIDERGGMDWLGPEFLTWLWWRTGASPEFAEVAVTGGALAPIRECHARVTGMLTVADEAVRRVNSHRFGRDCAQHEVRGLGQMNCECRMATKASLIHRRRCRCLRVG